MKHIIIIIALLSGIGKANGQSVGVNANSRESRNNSNRSETVQPYSEFDAVEMATEDGWLSFSSLPPIRGAIYAIVTNGDGEQMKQVRISGEYNTVDVHRLHKGLYFITVVYRNKGRKTFMLNR